MGIYLFDNRTKLIRHYNCVQKCSQVIGPHQLDTRSTSAPHQNYISIQHQNCVKKTLELHHLDCKTTLIRDQNCIYQGLEIHQFDTKNTRHQICISQTVELHQSHWRPTSIRDQICICKMLEIRQQNFLITHQNYINQTAELNQLDNRTT